MLDQYLGDGVYASFDGYHIWLDLRGQDGVRTRDEARIKIALDPSVFAGLQAYARNVFDFEEVKEEWE